MNTPLLRPSITTLIAAIMLTSTIQAGWIKRAKYAYNVLDGIGTWSFYSNLLENVKFSPNSEDSKLRARPDLETFEKTTTSGVYEGDVWDELVRGHGGMPYTHSYKGNYANYRLYWLIVEWDEEEERHIIASGAGGSSNGPHWWSKSTWEGIINSPGATQEASWADFMESGDPWTRPGYWITFGSSTKLEYPDVKIISEVSNPALFNSVLDGQLVKKAKSLGPSGLTYDVKVHFELQRLTWVPGANGTGYWQEGDWKTNDTDKFTHTFPGYQDDFTSMTLCPAEHRIRNEEVKGGIDIWWNKNITYEYAKVQTQPLDAQGNLTGEIKNHEGNIQKNIDYVIDYEAISPD